MSKSKNVSREFHESQLNQAALNEKARIDDLTRKLEANTRYYQGELARERGEIATLRSELYDRGATIEALSREVLRRVRQPLVDCKAATEREVSFLKNEKLG